MSRRLVGAPPTGAPRCLVPDRGQVLPGSRLDPTPVRASGATNGGDRAGIAQRLFTIDARDAVASATAIARDDAACS